MSKPATFWCISCDAWTPVYDATEDHSDNPANAHGFWCTDCGDDYLCDECGHRIDREGNCLRVHL